jgi:hypothetical protein
MLQPRKVINPLCYELRIMLKLQIFHTNDYARGYE